MEIDSFNLQQNYFELFELPVSSQPDQSALRSNYMLLQRQYHPDKFASASDRERRLAVQIASFVNQAHLTLSDSLKCAEYCLILQGVSVDAETDAKMDPMFLMEQMEWREALEDIDADDKNAFEKIDGVRIEIDSTIDVLAYKTAGQLNAKDTEGARDSIRKWQFLSKLINETNSLEARLDDQAG